MRENERPVRIERARGHGIEKGKGKVAYAIKEGRDTGVIPLSNNGEG